MPVNVDRLNNVPIQLYLIPNQISLIRSREKGITTLKTFPITNYPELPLLTNCIELNFKANYSQEMFEYAIHAFQRSIRTVHNLSPTLFQHIILKKNKAIRLFFYEENLGDVLNLLQLDKISENAKKMDKNLRGLWLPRCKFEINERFIRRNVEINNYIHLLFHIRLW